MFRIAETELVFFLFDSNLALLSNGSVRGGNGFDGIHLVRNEDGGDVFQVAQPDN